jgi:hypothetical protein
VRAHIASASVRLDGSFTAATRSGGLLLELPVDSSWAGPARIAVCREMLRPWLGGELRLVGSAAEPAPRELWFNEGVARALARELVFRFGMLTPEEYTDEINGIIGSVALSPFLGLPAAAVAERAATDVLARRHLSTRGVLYATWPSLCSASASARTASADARSRPGVQGDATSFGITRVQAFRLALPRGTPWPLAVAPLAGCDPLELSSRSQHRRRRWQRVRAHGRGRRGRAALARVDEPAEDRYGGCPEPARVSAKKVAIAAGYATSFTITRGRSGRGSSP